MRQLGSCTICDNPRRAAIDSALAEGGSLRTIAAQFQVNYATLFRHRRKHTAVLSARERREEAQHEPFLMASEPPAAPPSVVLLRYGQLLPQHFETSSMYIIRVMRLGVPQVDAVTLWVCPGKVAHILARLNRERIQAGQEAQQAVEAEQARQEQERRDHLWT